MFFFEPRVAASYFGRIVWLRRAWSWTLNESPFCAEQKGASEGCERLSAVDASINKRQCTPRSSRWQDPNFDPTGREGAWGEQGGGEVAWVSYRGLPRHRSQRQKRKPRAASRTHRGKGAVTSSVDWLSMTHGLNESAGPCEGSPSEAARTGSSSDLRRSSDIFTSLARWRKPSNTSKAGKMDTYKWPVVLKTAQGDRVSVSWTLERIFA